MPSVKGPKQVNYLQNINRAPLSLNSTGIIETLWRCPFLIRRLLSDIFHLSNLNLLRRVACEKCGKRFSKIENYMQHFQIVHEDAMYECKQCNIKISGMEQMRKHVRANHRYSKRI